MITAGPDFIFLCFFWLSSSGSVGQLCPWIHFLLTVNRVIAVQGPHPLGSLSIGKEKSQISSKILEIYPDWTSSGHVPPTEQSPWWGQMECPDRLS